MWHNVPVLGQAPSGPQGQAQDPGAAVLLQDLGWVDATALAVIATFCIIGLFKGFVWQVSRIAILALAYVLAGRFGADLGAWLHHALSTPGVTIDETATTPATTLYAAYVLIFLGVLIALSLLALLLQALVKKAGMTFFDRLGGGAIGIGTGACVVFFLLALVHMFVPRTQIAAAAAESHSLRWSRRALEALGELVPDEVRGVFALPPLRLPTTVVPGSLPGPVDGTPPGQAGDTDAPPAQQQPRRSN